MCVHDLTHYRDLLPCECACAYLPRASCASPASVSPRACIHGVDFVTDRLADTTTTTTTATTATGAPVKKEGRSKREGDELTSGARSAAASATEDERVRRLYMTYVHMNNLLTILYTCIHGVCIHTFFTKVLLSLALLLCVPPSFPLSPSLSLSFARLLVCPPPQRSVNYRQHATGRDKERLGWREGERVMPRAGMNEGRGPSTTRTERKTDRSPENRRRLNK